MSRVVTVDGFSSFRAEARALAAGGVPPEAITFRDAGAAQALIPGLFESAPEPAAPRPAAPPDAGAARVPRRFLNMAERVACHRDPGRWALLYRVLFRILHERDRLLDDAFDPDVRRLSVMDQQVHKDMHRMKAFVRFTRIRGQGEGEREGERYVAWHRPDHRIVALVAPFFADRFASMRWSIFTPDESAHWDGEALRSGPGAPRSELADPGEEELVDLWRAYYAAMFNPARVNLTKMRADMPGRFQRTLPELTVVPALVKASAQRTGAMIARHEAPAPTASDHLPAPALRTLPALREAAAGCEGCALHRAATQTVFGEGPADAPAMLVGEQPGDEEDRSGRPFVGPAGQLLDTALREVGLDRRDLYVTNAVKHFKFEERGKRRIHARPSGPEIRACTPWLRAEVEVIRPPRIVCLGASAARSFMGPEFRLTQRRGEVMETPFAPWWMATYHPAAILRMPDEAARAEALRAFTADLGRLAEDLRRGAR